MLKGDVLVVFFYWNFKALKCELQVVDGHFLLGFGCFRSLIIYVVHLRKRAAYRTADHQVGLLRPDVASKLILNLGIIDIVPRSQIVGLAWLDATH